MLKLNLMCLNILDQRRNYKNVFDAFIRIAKEEGVFTLWRGSIATIGRAIIVNVSQLATYSQAKHLIASRSINQFLISCNSYFFQCFDFLNIKYTYNICINLSFF